MVEKTLKKQSQLDESMAVRRGRCGTHRSGVMAQGAEGTHLNRPGVQVLATIALSRATPET